MPKDYTEQTIKDFYHDDYSDSAGFHKILFNSSRYLQARELTQLQTILQQQVTRFADNIFQDGAATNAPGAGVSRLEYVLISKESLGTNDVQLYVGKTLKNPPLTPVHGGLKFTVSSASNPVDEEQYATLYGNYTSANQSSISSDIQDTMLTFLDGDVLEDVKESNDTPDLTVSTRDGAPLSTGVGLLFHIQTTNFYTQGHFVPVFKQEIIISRHSADVDVDVGFTVLQDIITVEDDVSLYDNQGAVPNLASPGADRYRIRLKLVTRDAVADPLDFMIYAKVREGLIVKAKDGNNNYKEIEKRMALRQFDTNGDFMVNPFNLSYQAGNTDDTITMTVEGLTSAGEATAFVDGYRLVQSYDSDYAIPKPVSTKLVSSTSNTIAYKNFITVSNTVSAEAGLGLYPNGGNIETQTNFHLFNDSDNTVAVSIGTARIKSITKNTDNTDVRGVRLYLYDIVMNVNENFRNVEGISSVVTPTSTVGANPIIPITRTGTGQTAQNIAVFPKINESLFPIPGGRPKTISDVQFQKQRQFVTSVNGDGEITLTAGTNSTFENTLEWIFINRSDKTQHSSATPPAITLSGTSAVITGLNSGDNYTIFAYTKDNAAVAKVKRLKVTGYLEFEGIADADFTIASHYYDGYKLVSARTATGETGGSDLTDLVEFDGGQRDNFYSPIVIKRGSVDNSITTIYVKMEYFEWQGGGDFFSVSSYDLLAADAGNYLKFSYADIPFYVSTRDGTSYDLRNHFDFRSKLIPDAASMPPGDRFFLPKDGGQIIYDVEFYNRRIDNIVLGYNATTFQSEIRVIEGVEDLDPKPKEPNANEMTLFNVNYGGNTISTSDLNVKTHNYKRFTMKDIQRLENRVEMLEETVSLSFLEQSVANLVEINPDTGAIRSKTGFFVDDFSNGLAFTASPTGPNWVEDFASVGQTLLQTGDESYAIEPKNAVQAISMLFDSGGSTNSEGYLEGRSSVYSALGNDGNTNFKHTGDTIYLDYISTLDESLRNESISWKSDSANYEENGYYNVNPFAVFTGEGTLKLSPENDVWFDDIRLPTRNITRVVTNITRLLPLDTSTVDNSELDALKAQVVADNIAGAQEMGTFVVRQRNTIRTRNTVVSSDTTTTLNSTREDKMVMAYPFARSRPVYCKARGLRPDTRYWPYFVGVEVSQWCKSLQKAEYETHIKNKDHLKTYAPVKVGLTENPDGTSSLVSDRTGELFYSFFLPNTAPVASNNGRKFTSFKEWEQWGEEQKRLAAAQNSSIKDPAIYDSIGWKFKAGLLEMKLLDVSPIDGQGADETQALSRASAIYGALGFLRVTQRTNHYTRVTNIVTQQQTTGSNRPTIYKYDPLAQGFEIDARKGVPGAFITKVDVFLRKAPKTDTQEGGDQLAIPIQLQIREMEAGFPKSHAITEQFRVYKSADSCFSIIEDIKTEGGLENLEAVINNPVTFEFEEPVYIEGGREYAIVLLSECDNYEAFISTTHSLVLGKTTHRINKQPSSGSLFLSQNGSTWTPKQDQNMAYRVHTAKFKSEGNVNFANSKFPKFVHNQPRLSLDSADALRFRVNQFAHGMGVGDRVSLTGLDDTTDYYGVQGSVLKSASRVVAGADAGGYFVNLPASAAFNNTTPVDFGVKECESSQGFNFDRAVMDFKSLNFQGTSVAYKGNFISGNTLSEFGKSGEQDPRFVRDAADVTNMTNLAPKLFSKPKMLADGTQETLETTGPSIVISAKMESLLSSTFGNSSEADINNGYISDVSPIIDLQQCNFTMQNFQIDNQVLSDTDTVGSTSKQNKPYFFVPETDPSRGTSPSKQITKPIVLESASKGLRVFIDANKPPSASFLLYYRTVSGDDNIFDVNWILDEPTQTPPDNQFDADTYNPLDLVYSEYSYLIGGDAGGMVPFTSFQLKIVMKSSNSCEIPVINSIRAIALAT